MVCCAAERAALTVMRETLLLKHWEMTLGDHASGVRELPGQRVAVWSSAFVGISRFALPYPAGIVDDVYGADFVNGGKDGNVQDQNGHGTFVSGVVGAVGNNDLGVTGINQVLRLALTGG